MYTDLHERKGKYIIRLEARINHIMLIATFHGAPFKFSFETVLSILSVSESGVMNVTMYIPINNHHSILTQVNQLNILFLYIVLTICFLLGQEHKVNFENQHNLSNRVLRDIWLFSSNVC